MLAPRCPVCLVGTLPSASTVPQCTARQGGIRRADRTASVHAGLRRVREGVVTAGAGARNRGARGARWVPWCAG